MKTKLELEFAQNMGLEKIEDALAEMERKGSLGEETVSLTYSELLNIRKALLLDHVNLALSRENVKRACALRIANRREEETNGQ